MSEKYVLTRKELHLGYIKETFRAGAVLEHDEAKHVLVVDGRKFTDTRDLEVLKRQAANNPDEPWIVPFSKTAVEDAKASVPQTAQPKRVLKPGQGMKVVRSDEDLMDKEIDIRDTQVSRRTAAAKEAARNRPKSDDLPVIRGDEAMRDIRGDDTVEARLASLKGKNDIASMAERVRLKATGAAKMRVVKDDSLGSAGGSKAAAMNAGQVFPSRAEVESKTADAKAKADARKREAVARRASVVEGDGEAGGVGLLDAETTPAGDGGALAKENAELRARLAALEAKGSKVKRRPVTSVKTAKRVLAGG
jgi:hypothetical protein